MNFKERIEEGLKGRYEGLSNGFKRINKYIFNVQRSSYTLIGGLSGSAKTTLVDFMLLNAIEDANLKKIPINVFYYSLEIDEITKKANWLSMLIYKKHGITVSPEKIKGLGEFRLTQSELDLVKKEYDNLESLFSKINWVWDAVNPTGIYKECWNFMESRGSFQKQKYTDEFGNIKDRIIKFIPNNPEEYNIVVLDHMALMSHERGFDLKQNLDKLSEYCVRLRNLFGMTFFILQQFNQGLNSVDRQKFKGVDISPQQSDFKDSTVPYTDADVVLGIMNAQKMDMETCLGYNINNPGATYNLRDRFRMLKVIKNRLSRDNIAIGLLFKAKMGSFEELKPSNELNAQDIIKLNEG